MAMSWNNVGAPIKLDIDWQFTEPTLGVFFRFKHENAPVNAIYEIAQVEANDDGTYILFDSQVLSLEKGFVDTIKLAPPGIFTQRRLAIRRIPARPTFEQEIRRLLLPGYLQSTDIPPAAPARNRWTVQIESSDYVEPNATVDLSPIQSKLNEISQKIDNLQSGNSSTSTTIGKILTYESDSDTNGVFYWLGTNRGSQSWVNPYTAGFINITLSSALNGFGFVDGNPAALCDRTSNSVHTNDQIGATVAVDLKVNQLQINYYSIRQKGEDTNSNLRSWKLQASSDNTNWIDIHTQTNNSFGQAAWQSFPISSQSQSYRYWRILSTGANNSGNNFLVFGELELYGKLTNI